MPFAARSAACTPFCAVKAPTMFFAPDSSPYRTIAGVAEPDLEAGNDLAERARHDIAGTVREEDVPHLRRAETIEKGHAEALVPPGVELLGQALSRGGGQAERGQVLTGGLRVIHHLVDHGGDRD